ncbi:MAG: aldehyde dehydrogenase [Candidatus Diapherotrites archaeon]|nr:aldehyde dehydrogenase [Candidatus Diapherotrites archaeon]
MENKFDNIIGGKQLTLSGKYFTAVSPFYEDFQYSIADSNFADISVAISKAKLAVEECEKLKFEDRQEILTKAAKTIKFSDKEKKSVVKMTGMPIKYISKYLEEIPQLLENLPTIGVNRYGVINGIIARDLYEKETFHKIEFRHPVNGFVYAITPSNDPRTTTLVSTILTILGIPGIIKPSKFDCVPATKVITAIINAGYPQNALNVIYFDSENKLSNTHNFKLCDAAKVIWPFGDDKTVDQLLRLEHRKMLNLQKIMTNENNINQKLVKKVLDMLNKSTDDAQEYIEDQTIDHFASKIVLRHASGRCAGIVDSDFEPKKAVDLILESSMTYPIGCNSMKALFVTEKAFLPIIELLKSKFAELENKTGDPLDEKTEIGLINKGTIDYMSKRINELTLSGLTQTIAGGKKLSDTQVTPRLVTTKDIHSELLINEIPAYILAIKKSETFEDAVREANIAAKESNKLAISIFTNNHEHMKAKLKAHHLKINHPTTDVDGIIHEGNDYIMQLTKPHVVHIQKSELKKHPYRPAV